MHAILWSTGRAITGIFSMTWETLTFFLYILHSKNVYIFAMMHFWAFIYTSKTSLSVNIQEKEFVCMRACMFVYRSHYSIFSFDRLHGLLKTSTSKALRNESIQLHALLQRGPRAFAERSSCLCKVSSSAGNIMTSLPAARRQRWLLRALHLAIGLLL